MFWGRIFRARQDVVVAICDEKLLGKRIKFRDFKVDVSKDFYGERLIDGDVAVKAMKLANIGNLFGKDIVKLARENGFIDSKNVILIDGIPHAQFVKI
jgi:uncharacterized protein